MARHKRDSRRAVLEPAKVAQPAASLPRAAALLALAAAKLAPPPSETSCAASGGTGARLLQHGSSKQHRGEGRDQQPRHKLKT